MRRFSISIMKEETAAVAIIVGLLVTAFVGFLAFVVDIGYMYEMRRQLQSAADAAALAGMMEKIKYPTKTEPEILAAAREYADRNDLLDASTRLEMLTTAPDTVVTDDYVKIGVQKTANLFFAPIFNRNSQVVNAQAKAKKVYITGTKNIVPWGVGVVRAVDPVEASVNNGTWNPLGDSNNDRIWNGTLPVADTASGYLVDVRITNDQNYTKTYEDVAAINVDQPGDSVSNVRLTNNNLLPGGTTQLRIYSTTKPDKVLWNGKQYNVADAGGGLYTLSITAPSTGDMTDAFEAYPITVKISAAETHENAAVLIVRSTSSPIEYLELGQSEWFLAGGSTSIDLKMRDFVYGVPYTLKLSFGDQGEAGNFNGLDFSDIIHPDGYIPPPAVENAGGAYYSSNLENGYQFEVHKDDLIATKTGNMIGPTSQGMRDRFENCSCGCASASSCTMTWGEWDASDPKPYNCKRIIKVPIVEYMGPLNGKEYVVVVDLAVFFVTSPYNETENISGTFVRYIDVGEYSDTRPSGLAIETVRLDKPDY